MTHQLSDFLLDLYRLARECPADSFQREALELLARPIRFDSGRWGQGRFDSCGNRAIDHVHLQNEPPDQIQAYEEVMAQDVPMRDMLCRADLSNPFVNYQSGVQFASREMLGMREYQRGFGHENVLNVMEKRTDRTSSRYWNLSLYRARKEHHFVTREVTFVRNALPHLLEALKVNRASNLNAILRDVKGSSWTVGITDNGGAFLHCEPHMRFLLVQEWPNCRVGVVPRQLWDQLANNLPYRGRHITVRAKPMHGLLFVQVRPVCAADSLTPREFQVASGVASGLSHKEIARLLSIAPATARSHLQKIHDKLGAHRAAEVVCRLKEMD